MQCRPQGRWVEIVVANDKRYVALRIVEQREQEVFNRDLVVASNNALFSGCRQRGGAIRREAFEEGFLINLHGCGMLPVNLPLSKARNRHAEKSRECACFVGKAELAEASQAQPLERRLAFRDRSSPLAATGGFESVSRRRVPSLSFEPSVRSLSRATSAGSASN